MDHCGTDVIDFQSKTGTAMSVWSNRVSGIRMRLYQWRWLTAANVAGRNTIVSAAMAFICFPSRSAISVSSLASFESSLERCAVSCSLG